MYSLDAERLKSKYRQKTRNFFDNLGFVEVDTPLLSPSTIPEHTISLFKTTLQGEFTTPKSMWLLPSPELYMKKLLTRYKTSIYTICKSFRNAEQTSPIHSNEFTMLEFYQVASDYNKTAKLCAELLHDVFGLKAKVVNCTVSDLLAEFTGFSLADIHNPEVQSKISVQFNINLPNDETFDDTFNRIFVALVEPKLATKDEIYIIKDYPIEIECLAKQKDSLTRERFEIYYRGIELANGYSEMTNPKEVQKLFCKEAALINATHFTCNPDTELQTQTLPISSGVALGFERLIMAAEGIPNISDLIFN